MSGVLLKKGVIKGMIAKIEIYNDSGDLVSKCEASPYKEWIDYEDDYEVRKYDFRVRYAEYVPNLYAMKEGR